MRVLYKTTDENSYERGIRNAKYFSNANGPSLGPSKDISNVVEGVKSAGSVLSGEYKNMDGVEKKNTDMNTANAVKSVAKYTPVGRPIVTAINAAEKIPVAGSVVKLAERKIGKNINNKLSNIGSKVGNVPFLGSAMDKQRYRNQQKSEIQSLGGGSKSGSVNQIAMESTVGVGEESAVSNEFNRQKESSRSASSSGGQNGPASISMPNISADLNLNKLFSKKNLLKFGASAFVPCLVMALAFCLVAIIVGSLISGGSNDKTGLTDEQKQQVCDQPGFKSSGSAIKCN